MHNFQLGETSHLRVSFSKSTITPPVAPPHSINPAAAAAAAGAVALTPAAMLVGGVGLEAMTAPHLA